LLSWPRHPVFLFAILSLASHIQLVFASGLQPSSFFDIARCLSSKAGPDKRETPVPTIVPLPFVSGYVSNSFPPFFLVSSLFRYQPLRCIPVRPPGFSSRSQRGSGSGSLLYLEKTLPRLFDESLPLTSPLVSTSYLFIPCLSRLGVLPLKSAPSPQRLVARDQRYVSGYPSPVRLGRLLVVDVSSLAVSLSSSVAPPLWRSSSGH